MEDEILAKIREDFQDARIEVALDGNRAQITVESSVFADMSRVKKQQAVYACIQEYIADGRLHAVTINALTPDG